MGKEEKKKMEQKDELTNSVSGFLLNKCPILVSLPRSR